MARQRPIVHGRDHGWGGADQIADGFWVTVGATGAPPFQNGWGPVAGAQPLQFLISVGGWLRARGPFTGGADGTTVFTLPARYRPPYDIPVDIPTTDPNGIGRLLVQADGQVVYQGLVLAGISSSLDGKIPKALVDAKGDLLTATADDTPARLPAGTTGQVLTVDPTTATGLKWATAGGGAPSGPAGGDLSGSYPNPTVAKINGSPLGTITSPAAADRLRWNGSAWVNSAAVWRPVMVANPVISYSDLLSGQYNVAVTGDGDAVMTEG